MGKSGSDGPPRRIRILTRYMPCSLQVYTLSESHQTSCLGIELLGVLEGHVSREIKSEIRRWNG